MFEQFIIKSQLFNHSALERMELKNINIIFLKEYIFFKNIYYNKCSRPLIMDSLVR